jgi:hypothetical protein
MAMKKPTIDTRLVGQTSENIFLSLLNERGIFAASFDTLGFDGIVFDTKGQYFKIGKPPFYVQIKTRGSSGKAFNPQGHAKKTFDKIRSTADQLHIPESSLYLVVGFFRNGDLRQIRFFGIPFQMLEIFQSSDDHYRFSIARCEEAISSKNGIFSL